MVHLGYDLGAKFQTYLLSEKEIDAIKKRKKIAINDFSMNERTDCKIKYYIVTHITGYSICQVCTTYQQTQHKILHFSRVLLALACT